MKTEKTQNTTPETEYAELDGGLYGDLIPGELDLKKITLNAIEPSGDGDGFIKLTPSLSSTTIAEVMLRETPDDKSAPVETIKKGEYLLVIWESKEWYFVSTYDESKKGYIKKTEVAISDFSSMERLTSQYKKDVSTDVLKKDKQADFDKKLKSAEQSNLDKSKKKTGLEKNLVKRVKSEEKIKTGEKKIDALKKKYEKKQERVQKIKDLDTKIQALEDKKSTTKSDKKSLRKLKHERWFNKFALKFDKPESGFEKKLDKQVKKVNTQKGIYNTANDAIRSEREGLMDEKDKADKKQYGLTVFDTPANKTLTDSRETIMSDIQRQTQQTDVENAREKADKEKKKTEDKLKTLEAELNNTETTATRKDEIKEEINKLKNPSYDGGAAAKKLLISIYKGEDEFTYADLPANEVIVLLYYLMKTTLSGDEKYVLLQFINKYLNTPERVYEVFGYDGNKINPADFMAKFKDLRIDVLKDEKGKKAYKEDESKFWKPKKEKREEVKSKIETTFDILRIITKHPRKSKGELQESVINTVDTGMRIGQSFSILNAPSMKHARRYNKFIKNLQSITDTRTGVQTDVVAMEKKLKKPGAISKYLTPPKEDTLMNRFHGRLAMEDSFYVDAYELHGRLETTPDEEKKKDYAWEFYEKQYKGTGYCKTDLGYDSFTDKDDLWEKVGKNNKIFASIPPKYMGEGYADTPAQVRNDTVRVMFMGETVSEKHTEGTGNKSLFEIYADKLIANMGDKTSPDLFTLLKIYPDYFPKAYDLQKILDSPTSTADEKKDAAWGYYQQFYAGNPGLAEQHFEKVFTSADQFAAFISQNPTQLFYWMPARYKSGNKVMDPNSVYTTILEAFKDAAIKTALDEIAYQGVLDYVNYVYLKPLLKKVEKYWYIPAGIAALGVAGSIISDVVNDDSNIYKTFFKEGIPLAYLDMVPINLKFANNTRTINKGLDTQTSTTNFGFTNQPKREPWVGQNSYASKFFGPTSPAPMNMGGFNNSSLSKRSPAVSGQFYFNTGSTTTRGGETQKSWNLDTKLNYMGLVPNTYKLDDRPADAPQTYNFFSSMYPLLTGAVSPDFSMFNLLDPQHPKWSLANLTNQPEIESYLGKMPDRFRHNFMASLAMGYRPSPLLKFDSKIDFASYDTFGKATVNNNEVSTSLNVIGVTVKGTLDTPLFGGELHADAEYKMDYALNDPIPLTPMWGNNTTQIFTANLSYKMGDYMLSGTVRDDLMKPGQYTSFSIRLTYEQALNLKRTRRIYGFVEGGQNAAVDSMTKPMPFGNFGIGFKIR